MCLRADSAIVCFSPRKIYGDILELDLCIISYWEQCQYTQNNVHPVNSLFQPLNDQTRSLLMQFYAQSAHYNPIACEGVISEI